ncbi:hypothetical protein N7478_000853 [Penicillium angulare]|uniref:uncharacterized protein n=1 Tax=Penicillium angulare TaxID=116970 RepID=UPI0025421AD3|nr:uncharacterized protein N7478_000853 [Penicillium angulare]KAJ5291602.1 hypothetical protein N7478_000853 [Penicillium angulare]
MQIPAIFGIYLVALASTTAAMPHLAGPYHGQNIAVKVPTNSTGAHNATTTGTRGKAPLATGLSSVIKKNKNKNKTIHVAHGLNSIDHPTQGSNHCNELCSLEAQTCTVTMPDEDQYCSEIYSTCIKKCKPDNFQK